MTKWKVWQDASLAIPNVVMRDGARDLLLASIYRLQHRMVKHCIRYNPNFTDMFDEMLKCHTKRELIQHTKECLLKMFPDGQGVDFTMRGDYINTVTAISNWQDMEDLLSYPMHLSLRGRTTSVNETVQILKNFTSKEFKYKGGSRQTWIKVYNHLVSPNKYKQLALPFNPEVIEDEKMREMVRSVYNHRNGLYKKRMRAGLLLLFRDVNQHINPKPHEKGERASWEETVSTMHRTVGAVTLDAWRFTKKYKLKENITVDVLDLGATDSSKRKQTSETRSWELQLISFYSNLIRSGLVLR